MQIAPLPARLAMTQDCFKIMELYHRIYRGQYPDPLMKDLTLLRAFLADANHFWFVVDGQDSDLVASVVLRYDPENRIVKAFGAVVAPAARGSSMMERLLAYGIEFVQHCTAGVDVVYATTRTVHEAAQALTEKLGFRKLGIFPNSHKTAEYETHCLTALYLNRAVEERFQAYSVHAALEGLVSLVTSEVPEMGTLSFLHPEAPTRHLVDPPILEIIESEHFVRHRFERLKSGGALQFAFFPFHSPNLLVTSPDQEVEIFCYHSRQDGYSVIIGGKVPDSVSFTALFNTIANLLREAQARYVELLIRADKPKIIDSILKAKFIPSAFFPAFQLHGGHRYDYVVMSKTFEIFDFQNVHLKGLNQKYLDEYVRNWMRSASLGGASYPLEEFRRPSLRFSLERSDSRTSAEVPLPVPSR
jgi:RimJ/RimL family protein N-acetyltransferase